MATGLDTWFHNFSQVSYYANTPKNVADVKSPYIEYGIYMTFKAVQVSSFIGKRQMILIDFLFLLEN